MILGGLLGQHHVVHRRGDHERCAAREHRPRDDLVGESERQLRHGVGGRRNDGDHVGPLGQLDVALSPALGCEPIRGDRVVGEGFERQRRDEPGRLRGHHDADLGPGLGEQPDALDRLVGRDPAADADRDPASL